MHDRQLPIPEAIHTKQPERRAEVLTSLGHLTFEVKPSGKSDCPTFYGAASKSGGELWVISRMTTVAQRDQIGWIIPSSRRPWKKVMDVSLGSTALRFAFDTLKLVASEDALSQDAPIRSDRVLHADINPLSSSWVRFSPSWLLGSNLR
ncbi:hypothetical protein ABIF72_006272 [Bradyrhizobium japonicum]